MTPRGERRRANACSLRDLVHASNERSEHDSQQVHHLPRRRTALVLAALAVAGCGARRQQAIVPGATEDRDGQSATLGVANENLGKILVDSQGRTLYLFQKRHRHEELVHRRLRHRMAAPAGDRQADGRQRSECFGVATSARSDGKPQVTYNGHPLYLFSADQKPGDTNGQGVNAFGGLWYVLSSSGDEITTATGSGGGLGY